MKITLKDIAEHANVSISSVSRALNNANSPTLVNDKLVCELFKLPRTWVTISLKINCKKTKNFQRMKRSQREWDLFYMM
ncbi:LacI family DNA-binding transcriptional regulator [Paenibacillus sp. JZ16]|uniref:LacI family DNA-binding transcriptional regulator n=1 Tax=Paenibacillus sp. JZ16 TaxID=1906272 RepID=UPI00188BFD56